MKTSVFVGRIGSLAVALGVGAAVATGISAPAWAAPPDSGGTSQDSSAQDTTSSTTDKNGPKTATDDTPSTDATTPKGVTVGNSSSAQNDESDPQATADDDPADQPVKPKRKSSVASVIKAIVGKAPASKAPAAKTPASKTPDTSSAASRAKSTARTAGADKGTDTDSGPAADATASAVTTTALRTVDSPAQTSFSLTSAQQNALAATVNAETPPPAAADPVQQVVTNVLSAFGLGSPASGSPLAPAQSPLLVALLGWATRKETGTTADAAAAAPTAKAAAPITAAAVAPTPTPVNAWTDFVAFQTGGLWPLNREPDPKRMNGTIDRFGIAGTDLGIMWDNGYAGVDRPETAAVEQRQVLMAFGDTFSIWRMNGNWRSNVLFRTADNYLGDGMNVPNGVVGNPFSGSPMDFANLSRQFIAKPVPSYVNFWGPEVTIIPTAGVSVPYANAYGTRQYVNFMSVRSWDTAGRWTTNYSGVAYSDDNGQTWKVAPSSIRSAAWLRTTTPYVAGNENFQQGAYVKPPATLPNGQISPDANYVYSYGTPSGRFGNAYVSRVTQDKVLDQTQYEYWNGSSWIKNNPSAARPVMTGPVSEMSVQYNPYLKKYVAVYTDARTNNVVVRTADRPEGTWTAPKTLATSTQVPGGIYAPMIHPWSGTTRLADDPKYLYWNVSVWDDYNVKLMRSDLSKVYPEYAPR